MCTSCRASKMLSNACFLAKFRFDTAENEPAKILQILQKRLQNFGRAAGPRPGPVPGHLRPGEALGLRAALDEGPGDDPQMGLASAWRPELFPQNFQPARLLDRRPAEGEKETASRRCASTDACALPRRSAEGGGQAAEEAGQAGQATSPCQSEGRSEEAPHPGYSQAGIPRAGRFPRRRIISAGRRCAARRRPRRCPASRRRW